MKCYLLLWNPDCNTYKLSDHSQLVDDLINNGQDFEISWQLKHWQDAHKGDMFILLQCNTANDGIAMIGKFDSEPYEQKNNKTGKNVHKVNLHILSAFDRTPQSKILVTFQLKEEFSQINWKEGPEDELLEMFTADKLCLRIIDEMQARDMWNDSTFGDFFNIQTFKHI